MKDGSKTGIYSPRLVSYLIFIILAGLVSACMVDNTDPITREPGIVPTEPALFPDLAPAPGHMATVQSIHVDFESEYVEIIPDRSLTTHLDLAWLQQYYLGMLKVAILGHDPDEHLLTLAVTFTNPLDIPLGDVRAIFPSDGMLVPLTIDGWSVRSGAPVENPDPYFVFGKPYTNRMMGPGDEDTREIVFQYEPPLSQATVSFVLDATVDANTAEPYDFGEPNLTGRFFHISVSDWQDDITSVFLDIRPYGYRFPLRLAGFGDENDWGTSIPDIPAGDYRLRVVAESPEAPGEIDEEEPAVGVHWVEFTWPPEGQLVPLPRGQGIYAYNFIDPDTNQPPTDIPASIEKFRNGMGGDWVVVEYGDICNSGYMSMHTWLPVYVSLIQEAAPDLPILLNFDKLLFPPPSQDPCLHEPEKYTVKFFNHLLESVRGQVLENPDFDSVTGFFFDIEVFPGEYPEEELFEIYARYADFLARLHLEPALNGRNITLYDFDRHPVGNPGDLAYLCTVDAFMGASYFSRWSFSWDPEMYSTQFHTLEKMLGTYRSWAQTYGRPYYPCIGTFSCWIDAYGDTFPELTVCPGGNILMIDEWCFGLGPLNTSDEYIILHATEIHGMIIERVLLTLDTGEEIFPSNGFSVYLLGDGNPDTIADDSIVVRSAYSLARVVRIIHESHDPLMLGYTTFRYETNQSRKGPALSYEFGRGDITAVSGMIRFSDGLDLQHHPELWGGITIELVDPLTPDILENPSYRTSIDLIGVADGNYIFPDLPRAVLTIRAYADGWVSDLVVVDNSDAFAYSSHVDIILHPE